MRKISYIELGGTLFIPAIHKNLELILKREKYPNLKSLLIDTEDGLDKENLHDALKRVESILQNYQQSQLLVFIRPKNTDVLIKLLELSNIEKIDGFILPKFSLANATSYFDILRNREFNLMPSIEGEELFDQNKLIKLRDIILTNKEKIVLVRYGLEDMLRQLKMKRQCEDSIFDFAVTSSVLGNFIAVFKSEGFAISGGVYPCFKDTKGYEKDLKRDMKEGLFSKTIIHPSQIDPINQLYMVNEKELQDAKEICESKEVVFAQNNTMAEKITMIPYSQEIIKRSEVYGVSFS